MVGEHPVRAEPGAGDVVDQLPPLVRPQAHDVRGPDVGVVPPASGERYVHLVLREPQVPQEEAVHQRHHLLPDAQEHLRVRHLLRAFQMVGVEVEDELRAHPSLLVHGGGVRATVVRRGVVAVGRDLVRHEPSQLLGAFERQVPLNVGLVEEHEPELPPGEPVRHRRRVVAVVSLERLVHEALVRIHPIVLPGSPAPSCGTAISRTSASSPPSPRRIFWSRSAPRPSTNPSLGFFPSWISSVP